LRSTRVLVFCVLGIAFLFLGWDLSHAEIVANGPTRQRVDACLQRVLACGAEKPALTGLLAALSSPTRTIRVKPALKGGNPFDCLSGSWSYTYSDPEQTGVVLWGERQDKSLCPQDESCPNTPWKNEIEPCATLVHELAHMAQTQRPEFDGNECVPQASNGSCVVQRKESDAVYFENLFRTCSTENLPRRCCYGDPAPNAPCANANGDCKLDQCLQCGDGVVEYQEACDFEAPAGSPGQNCDAIVCSSQCNCCALGPENGSCEPECIPRCLDKQPGDKCYQGGVNGGSGYCIPTYEGKLICTAYHFGLCRSYRKCSAGCDPEDYCADAGPACTNVPQCYKEHFPCCYAGSTDPLCPLQGP